ncbi:hypothetical protein B0T20DRAFT_416164 [Sordaria brevicollis]|uniref:Uncharacterized protein n=1 Tax=Sordaria brevicollis TaxID=83679 RepID=A0AAE0PCJ8_SORBR|nr:hypothetical protein B0T20DRAFT_416164 [Sordaria brevicollis]
MKISDTYEDESVYNDGENGGPPPSSRGGSLMEGRTALSPPPPAIPPRARSRSRPAPGEPAAAAAPDFPFAGENLVASVPVPVPPAPPPAASALLSPFPPRPKSVRLGVGTGPVKRQSSADGLDGVGCAVSYDYLPVPSVPPPPAPTRSPPSVRSAVGIPPAPKWAPPTIPGYGDDAKPLRSNPSSDSGLSSGSGSGAGKDKPQRKSARNTRLSIFPGPSPSPTPSTQGWSSSPLSSPAASTPPIPGRHRRDQSGGTAETEERGRPAQKRQSTLTQVANGGQTQSPSPAPTLEAWLKRGMSSTRVPVRTSTGTQMGTGIGTTTLPRSASTSNLRRQSYTARLREQVREQHLLDVSADDGTGGRGEDWPIRQS